MSIRVNGVEIDDAAIENEVPQHAHSDDPQEAARQTLVLRELMLQRARSIGVTGETPEEILAALIEQEVTPEPPDEAACRAFFEEHRDSFVRDEMIEASHILLQLGDSPDPELLKITAELVLAQVTMNPERFDELAREYSACPSGEEGGFLGQIAREQTVPEFEQALFGLGEHQLCDQLVETQFGLHIIKSGARTPAGPLSFEETRDHLATYLAETGLRIAMQPYLRHLAAQATIEGYTLPAA